MESGQANNQDENSGANGERKHYSCRRTKSCWLAIAIAALSIFCAGSAGAWNSLTPLTNLVVCPGETATFTTTASGPTPYRFQWYKNGVTLAGKTNSSLTISNVVATNAGTYMIVLKGGYNSVTNSATLTVRTLVSVAPLPNLVRFAGGIAVFTPSVTGTGPFTYVWKKDGNILNGQTSSTLVLTNLSTTNSGSYSVTVSGSCNSATASGSLMVDTCFPSVDVMLVIDRSGSMTGQPYNDARLACSNFVPNLHFTNNGDKCGLVSYNSSATLDQKLTNNVAALDRAIQSIPAAGGYTAISLGLQTAQTELTSTRHNTNALPVIILLSDGLPTAETKSNTLYNATQVKYAGSRIFTVGFGAVDPNLLASVASSPSDFYYGTNSSQLSSLFTAIATIICRPPTNIVVTGPSNQTVCAGSPAIFSVTASGCDSFTYQWNKNGARLNGQTNNSLVIPSASTNDAGVYSVEVHSICRSVTNSATLTVNQQVVVTIPPMSLTNCPGTIATFRVSASGTALSYQWYRAGNVLVGQTTSSMSLTNVSSADAAVYSVVVSGACGNSVSNSASLTVTVLPMISCVGNKTVQLGNPWNFDAPTANYPIMVVSTVTNTAGHCGKTFDATRTWAAIDACNNSAQCSQTVTVVDTTPPIINCGNTNKTVELGTAWTFDPPTATDNSGTNITIMVVGTVTNTASHCGNTFAATRTWAAIDACNNSAQCSQTVTVVDTTPPIINCGNTNKTVELGTAWTFDPPTATDNGGTNITIMVVSTVTNTASHCGNTFAATRTWAAIDACNNSAQCSQTVTVVDTTPPIINCGNTNKTVELGTAWTFDPPTATDNGGTNITIMVVSTVTNTAGHCGNTFAATRTWAAIDACNNSAQCSQTVTVVDTTPPIINCSNTNKTVELGTAWTFDPPTATDNSGTNITIMIVGTVTNTAGHCGNTFAATRTWAAIDACNNSAQCSQTVTVVDTTPPIINCSNTNKTVELGTPWTFDAPTATDNSGTNITIMVVGTVTNTAGHCGNTFAATRTWAAIDACNNSAQCSQTVTVVDTTPPIINCGNTNKTVELGTPWTFDPPTATDNSGTNITIMIVSTVTNTAGHCGGSFDATRTWAAIDGCNNSAQCSQKVTVVDTNPIVVISPPSNQTNCFGTIANFSIVAQGTGLTYAWLRNGSIVGTNNTLALDTSVAGEGRYTVIVTDQCNDTVTNSAVLVVNARVDASPLSNAVKNLGDSVTFATTASGTGPFTYVWKKNGGVIAGATTSSLTLTNLTFADDADYTVEVTGTCNTAVQTAHLTVNHPPTVDIISPTNGTVFIAPATFTLAANAQDIDGVVTNITFFQSLTNKLGETTNSSPGLIFLTNQPVGWYTFTAIAADNLGARGTSAPVSISVIAEPPLVLVSSIRLNPQTGLFEQNVRVLNPTYNSVYAIRVTIGNLTNGTVVYNPSGFTNGIAYVQSHAAVPAGAYVDFVIEYYIPSRIIPDPALHAQLVPPDTGGGTVAFGFPVHVDRGLWLPNKTFLVEFLTISNRAYSIQYSSNLTNWRDAQPAVVGNGTRIQWIDNGQPKTETSPASQISRFYRVVLLP